MSLTTVQQKDGKRLDALYSAFKAATEAAKDGSIENKERLRAAANALFTDVSNYAQRVFWKQANRNSWTFAPRLAADLTQTVCLKVWQQLRSGCFKEQSQFSTWLFDISKNAITDLIRMEARRQECSILDWKAYGECAGKRQQTIAVSLPGVETFRGSAQPIMAKKFLEASEQACISSIDWWDMLSRLSPDDRALVIFKDMMGYSARAIAIHFGQNVRWVNNRYAAIKRMMLPDHRSAA